MAELNVKQKNVLTELIKTSKITDKEIAKKLGYSQPTVTRIRSKLEDGGYILKYCTIPNLIKIGYELAAILAFSSRKESEKNEAKLIGKKAMRWTLKNKQIIFAASGTGFEGRTYIMITVHKNFTEYDTFMREFRRKWTGKGLADLTTFLIPLPLILKFVVFEDLL